MKQTGITSIAVRGKDSVVFITQKKVSDKLIDADSVTRVHKVRGEGLSTPRISRVQNAALWAGGSREGPA